MQTKLQKPVELPVPRVLLPIGDPRRDLATVKYVKSMWEGIEGRLELWSKVISDLKKESVWERYPPENPYGSLDALLKNEIGLTYSESQTEIAIRMAHQATPLNPNGTNRFSEREVSPDNNKGYGTDPEYLTSRIARDRPDVLERMKQGEFKSVRAAAIEAKIVKDSGKMTLSTEDPSKAATTILNAVKSGKVSIEYVQQLVTILVRRISDKV